MHIHVYTYMCFLHHDISCKGWNSHVPKEFPGCFESTDFCRDNLSGEIGRTPCATLYIHYMYTHIYTLYIYIYTHTLYICIYIYIYI